MTMRRKAGWYWAMIDGKWAPLYWDGGRWLYIGTRQNAVAEVGHRIPTPDEPANTYLQAADEMLVVAGIGTAEPGDDLDTTKRKLGELIDWHVAVAMDERVNGGYRLVPVEPTPDMLFELDAGRAAYGSMRGGYRAMLEAARRATDGP